MRLYHVTTSEAAAAIERRGFRDGDDLSGPLRALMGSGAPMGVWLSYAPLEPGPDLPPRRYDACFAIDVPRDLLDKYEWIIPGFSAAGDIREAWCVPAAALNALGRPERVPYASE